MNCATLGCPNPPRKQKNRRLPLLPKPRLTKVKTTKFAAVANQSLRILKVNPRDFSRVFYAKTPKNTEFCKKKIRPTRICCSENAHRKLGPTFPVRELRGKKVKKNCQLSHVLLDLHRFLLMLYEQEQQEKCFPC